MTNDNPMKDYDRVDRAEKQSVQDSIDEAWQKIAGLSDEVEKEIEELVEGMESDEQ